MGVPGLRAKAARAYPGFRLVMEAEATGVFEEDGRISGVRYMSGGDAREMRARLVIASDGRRPILRDAAALEVQSLGAPMDVFWFRVPKSRGPANETAGYFAPGRIVVLIDRGDYWQCAWVIPKGQADAVRSRGLEVFRAETALAAPLLASEIWALSHWDDVKLLTVALDRLERWHKPGLLVIGDAAHAMSPIAGVGINLAIQDAVAAANLLAGPIVQGQDVDSLLHKVQARRSPAVRAIQRMQQAVQDRIVNPVLGGDAALAAPRPLRLLDGVPMLRRIPAALIGFGIRPEHVRSHRA